MVTLRFRVDPCSWTPWTCHALVDSAPPHAEARSNASGADGAQMTVAARTVVERFDVTEDVAARQVPGLVNALAHAFFFKLLKNDSATALSRQLPRRLMLGWSLL